MVTVEVQKTCSHFNETCPCIFLHYFHVHEKVFDAYELDERKIRYLKKNRVIFFNQNEKSSYFENGSKMVMFHFGSKLRKRLIICQKEIT